MLLDPISYKETIKNFSLEDLIQESEMLLKEIRRYEKNKKKLDQTLMHPTPRLIYQMNKEYLVVVRELIMEKMEYKTTAF